MKKNLIDDIRIKKEIQKKKIIVTGGTGLIGRQLTQILCNLGAKVTVVSLDKLKIEKRAKHIIGDLSDYKFCLKITKNFDYAFHLAGIKGSVKTTLEKPSSFYVPLLMMNTNFLEACRINRIKKLVYTSSIGAYSKSTVFKEKDFSFKNEPMDFYPGWAKRMAELQISAYKKQFNLKNFYIVRPANVYGPGDNFDKRNAMVIPSLISKIFNNRNLVKVWGDGKAIRDFAFSEDIALGIVQTLIYGTGKHNFLNLGSGKGVTIKELLETMQRVVKFKYKFNFKKNKGFSKRVMDISLAKKIIKYNHNTTLEDGLRKTWIWYLKNTKEYKMKKNYFI